MNFNRIVKVAGLSFIGNVLIILSSVSSFLPACSSHDGISFKRSYSSIDKLTYFHKDTRRDVTIVRKGSTKEIPSAKTSPPRVFCYYNTPRVNDIPYSVFPEALNASICSHIVVNSAQISNLTLSPPAIDDLEFYIRTIKLKKRNPNLKILLSLVSVNDDTGKEFASMVSDSDHRHSFIVNSVETLNKFGFDGLEIDWRFPCFDGPSEQRLLFTQLFHDFRDYINNGSFKLMLSAAVSARKDVIDVGYDIPGLARYVDYVSLMSYDYHTFTWITPFTGPNSPLHHPRNEVWFLNTLNMAWSAYYWYQNGMPVSKIILGVPTYGRSFTLVNPENHDYYSIADGVGRVGYDGFAMYPEVCAFINHPNITVVFDNDTQVPYAYSGKEWISYENEESARLKALWIQNSGFAGVAIKDLNSDDPYKQCKMKSRQGVQTNATAFPITNAIYKIFFPSKNNVRF